MTRRALITLLGGAATWPLRPVETISRSRSAMWLRCVRSMLASMARATALEPAW
jgi:hypothetical protein